VTWNKWQPILKEEMKKEMNKAPQISEAHKIDHILRVWEKSRLLAEKTGADLEAMVAIVFLHDLARHHGHEIHGEKSAEMAAPILKKIKFPEKKIPIVLDAIAKHDYTTLDSERKSLESKILYDSDKLDAFGAIGILRHINFYYNKGKTIDEILVMLDKRWAGITLKESKEIGRNDFEYVKDFFMRLKKEVEV
jgi:HD superfamily phosphodiesterase